MRILAINRPAIIESNIGALDREFRAARWTHHRLLDFEQQHQDHMNDVAELCAPGIRRVGALVARLKRREKRAERSTGWSPPLHTDWRLALEAKLTSLRKQRNSDPRWADALKWADAADPNGQPRGKAKLKQRSRQQSGCGTTVSQTTSSPWGAHTVRHARTLKSKERQKWQRNKPKRSEKNTRSATGRPTR